MKRRAADDPLREFVKDPIVQAVGFAACALALGGTLAYVHGDPERRRRFWESGRRVAREYAEARRKSDRQFSLIRMRHDYFASAAGVAALIARGALLVEPVGRPLPDAATYAPALNAYSYGRGFVSKAAGVRFEWYFDHHDAVGGWTFERDGPDGQKLKGSIARPDERLTLYCPPGHGSLDPAQRQAILRLLATPPSRIREAAFVGDGRRAVEDAIWRD